jgi:integrase
MQGKQAKIVSPTQERAIVGYLDTTRYPARDRVMFLLSMKAGLRAKEIASLTWAMVTDAAGQVSETIHLENRASKGMTGGRTIPMHPDVYAALVTLQSWRSDAAGPDRPVIFSERGGGALVKRGRFTLPAFETLGTFGACHVSGSPQTDRLPWCSLAQSLASAMYLLTPRS